MTEQQHSEFVIFFHKWDRKQVLKTPMSLGAFYNALPAQEIALLDPA